MLSTTHSIYSPLGFLFKASLVLFFVLFLLNRSFAEASEPVQTLESINQVKAGQLLFIEQAAAEQQSQAGHSDEVLASDKRYTPSLLLANKVHFDISGMVARASLSQQFINDSSHYVEGIYVFPLPDDSAVKAMKIRVGDRLIVGKIKEKQQARKVYQQARAAGKKAGLVEQQRPNMFTTRVANIAPGETISVELVYIQKLVYRDQQFSLRFPMTITPRYIPGSPLVTDEETDSSFIVGKFSWGVNTDQVPDASLITPFVTPQDSAASGPTIELTANIDMGLPIEKIDSRYHEVDVMESGSKASLTLKGNNTLMDRDFVLDLSPQAGAAPRIAVFSETVAGQDYALLMVLPPKLSSKNVVLPKERIFIVDTSGSMGGQSIEQARESLLLGLDQLHSDDLFNIIQFNNETRPLFDRSVAATAENIYRARMAVKAMRAGGGTEMYPALQYALQSPSDEAYLRQVVFITDGAVGNEQALFKLIHDYLGSSRLFTVGIGSAPNSYFMSQAAKFGRGTHTHIGQMSEISTSMSRLFTKLENPVARNISVEWPGGSDVEQFPAKVPDLYQGEPMLVTAKHGDLQGDIRIQGDTAGEQWQRVIQLKNTANHTGVATIWAREKIADLMSLLVTGEAEGKVKPKVLATALAHSLLSQYTSFVAVEEQPSRPVSEPLKTKPVANKQPHGQSPQVYAYPATSTGLTAKLLYGLMMLFFALVLLLTTRYEQALLDKQQAEKRSHS